MEQNADIYLIFTENRVNSFFTFGIGLFLVTMTSTPLSWPAIVYSWINILLRHAPAAAAAV